MLLQHFLTGIAVTWLVARIGLEHQIVVPRLGARSLGKLKAPLVVGSRFVPEAQGGIKRAAINIWGVQAGLDFYRSRELLVRRGPIVTVVVLDSVVGDFR